MNPALDNMRTIGIRATLSKIATTINIIGHYRQPNEKAQAKIELKQYLNTRKDNNCTILAGDFNTTHKKVSKET